jgi:hypothetical protein
MADFAPNVERWRPLMEELSAGIPIDFLLKWITVESAGNTCAIGSPAQAERDGFPNEVGIFQIGTFASQSTVIAGVTVADLRAGCDGFSQNGRTLTEDEFRIQAVSGVDYVQGFRDDAHTALDNAGVDWSEDSDDFWALVKMFHAAPAFIGTDGGRGGEKLRLAQDAGAAATFADFRQFFAQEGFGFSAAFQAKVFDNCEKTAEGVGGSGGGNPFRLPGSDELLGLVIPGLVVLGAAYLYPYFGKLV